MVEQHAYRPTRHYRVAKAQHGGLRTLATSHRSSPYAFRRLGLFAPLLYNWSFLSVSSAIDSIEYVLSTGRISIEFGPNSARTSIKPDYPIRIDRIGLRGNRFDQVGFIDWSSSIEFDPIREPQERRRLPTLRSGSYFIAFWEIFGSIFAYI